jgi:hypothetical protein
MGHRSASSGIEDDFGRIHRAWQRHVCETKLRTLLLSSTGIDGYGNRKLKRDRVSISHYDITKAIVVGTIKAGTCKRSLQLLVVETKTYYFDLRIKSPNQ